MRDLFLALTIVIFSTGIANAQQARCVTSGSFVWGYNTTWSGTIKAGQPCRASYSSSSGSYQGHKIVSQPRNGSLRVGGVSNGVPTFVYQPKAGFSGSDTFTIELTGAGVNRQTGTSLPPASTQITYNMSVAP
jgi:hypothetical protein